MVIHQITAIIFFIGCFSKDSWDVTGSNEDLVLWKNWLHWISLLSPLSSLWKHSCEMSLSAPSSHVKNAHRYKIVISHNLSSVTITIAYHLPACLNLWVWVQGAFTPNHISIPTWLSCRTNFPHWWWVNKIVRLTTSSCLFPGLCSHKHIYLARMLRLRLFRSGNKMLCMENSSFYCFPIQNNLGEGQKMWSSYKMRQPPLSLCSSLWRLLQYLKVVCLGYQFGWKALSRHNLHQKLLLSKIEF